MAQNERDFSRAVFLLWHTDNYDDEKLIGVYETEEQATSAITRLKDKPGFSEPGGKFEVAKYELNRDHWTEGFARQDGFSLPKWLFRPTDSE